MTRSALLALLLLSPLPVRADAVVDRVVDALVLPRFDTFAQATADLDRQAQASCEVAPLRAAWNAASDAWIPAQIFRTGPLEAGGRGLAISFWPDPKGATPAALRRMLSGDPAAYASAAVYGTASVAARGLPAMEALLYGADFEGTDPGVLCAVLRAQAGDLASVAATVAADWRDTYAAKLKTAGAADNPTFLSAHEARQSLYTAMLTQLGFDAETRLGRPLGTADKPRATRAESRASERSLHNVQLSLIATEEVAKALAEAEPATLWARFDDAKAVAAGLSDPVFAEVATPEGWARVHALKSAIGAVHDAANAELAPMLGVMAGFNSLDGD